MSQLSCLVATCILGCASKHSPEPRRGLGTVTGADVLFWRAECPDGRLTEAYKLECGDRLRQTSIQFDSVTACLKSIDLAVTSRKDAQEIFDERVAPLLDSPTAERLRSTLDVLADNKPGTEGLGELLPGVAGIYSTIAPDGGGPTIYLMTWNGQCPEVPISYTQRPSPLGSLSPTRLVGWFGSCGAQLSITRNDHLFLASIACVATTPSKTGWTVDVLKDGRIGRARVDAASERELRSEARHFIQANAPAPLWPTFEESLFAKFGDTIPTGIPTTKVFRPLLPGGPSYIDWIIDIDPLLDVL
jgi:hypothetical protein